MENQDIWHKLFIWVFFKQLNIYFISWEQSKSHLKKKYFAKTVIKKKNKKIPESFFRWTKLYWTYINKKERSKEEHEHILLV